MITTITPLRRVAVTLVLTGATAFGAIGIAPAAFADDSAAVVEQAPVIETAPQPAVPEVVEAPAPVDEAPARVVEEAPAPVLEQAPAPVAEAPAPVVEEPPVVVIGKDGKPVKKPHVCTDKDNKEYADRLAKATQQAAPLNRAAAVLHQAADLLRDRAAQMSGFRARFTLALADLSDGAADRLEAQAQAVFDKVGGIGCIVVTAPGGRF